MAREKADALALNLDRKAFILEIFARLGRRRAGLESPPSRCTRSAGLEPHDRAPPECEAASAGRVPALRTLHSHLHPDEDRSPMSGRPKFYITTAISYPNGQPHIGHAYEAIATDAIARFERLDGKDVYFLTGTDEHGLKMKQTAAKEGLTPRELADRNAKRFREMAGLLGLSNDDFIRTTEPRHYRASEEIWRRMEAAGDIFLKKYAGWYSVRDEAYYNESETDARRGRRSPRSAGHAGRVDGGGDVFLQAVRLPGQAARALRRQPRLHPAARAAQRGRRASSKAAWRICRSRARRSTGASRCRSRSASGRTPRTSCTCGSTR